MASKDLDFGFGFNDIDLSDRVVRLEIEHDDIDEGGCDNEVKTVHISSIILADKSPFFLKLFSNGMKESEESQATLKIHSSEEAALMDVLNFMYTNKLSSSTTSSLLDVLMVADKFQVSSCLTYCIQLLSNLPMTCESALQFLDLPSSVLMAEEVQRLVDAAEKCLVDSYKEMQKCEEEVLNLPIAAFIVVLSSDNLEIGSEDVVYDFVLKWTRKHLPMVEERRELITTRLGPLIRYEYMRYPKLKKIPTCNDFDPAYASKVVLDALFSKAQPSHLQTIPRFVERAYTLQLVRVLEFKSPHPNCVVYLDLKKEECVNLLPSQYVYCEEFNLGGKWFYLAAGRWPKGRNNAPYDSFGLFLGLWAEEPDSCSVAFQFSARSKPAEEFFHLKPKMTITIKTEGPNYGYDNLFGLSWRQFVDEDSVCFINGVLYLKAEIRINP